MKSLPISEVKSHFSSLLKEVEAGNEIIISFGKKRKKVAVIIPYAEYIKTKKRQLGALKGKLKVEFKPDFKMSEEEFLES